MQSWGDAYRRLRQQHKFKAWFGKNCIPGPNDFTFKAYTLIFSKVTGRTDDADPDSAPVFGPRQLTFDRGAIVLGITSAAFQAQMLPVDEAVAPSVNVGRRDLYKLNLSFTDDEDLTVLQSTFSPTAGAVVNVRAFVLADALLGSGLEDEFPRDLMVPPSTGFNVSVQSYMPGLSPSDVATPPLYIHVVFHCVVPKGN